MVSYSSNLAFLMDKLKLSGKDISRALDIDNSLVSKWRNNKRPLNINTANLDNLADYLLNHKKGVHLDLITNILVEYYPAKSFKNKGDVHSQLVFWLTEPYEPITYQLEITDNEPFTVFCGNDGRREAVLFFLDEVLKQDEPQNLYLISQEEMSWIIEDSNFLLQWRQKLEEILSRGNKINVIHWVDRSTSTLGDIIEQWLPLYLTGNIQSWFFPKYSETLLKSTLFLIKDRIAITGMEGARAEDRYTLILTDSFSLKHYEWVFDSIRKKCHPLVNVFSVREKQLLNQLDKFKDIEGELISIANFPGFFTLPENMFNELLKTNNIDKAVEEMCINYYKKINSLFKEKEIKSIYTKDGIKNALNYQKFIYKDLSLIAGKNISASKDFAKRHLKHLIDKSENDDSFHAGLVDSFTKLDVLINSEGYALTWNPVVSEFLVSVTEPNVVSAYYVKLLDLWDGIPRIYKNEKELRERLGEY